ncbi:hypothetical protein V6N12_047195 [Hibiscus sabdariffa]|uniref:Uncharacterized protein n=1 Tax=Hibiscus sabdariffa TaxID=183260 RepID=A0ABR2DD37_9ROSI
MGVHLGLPVYLYRVAFSVRIWNDEHGAGKNLCGRTHQSIWVTLRWRLFHSDLCDFPVTVPGCSPDAGNHYVRTVDHLQFWKLSISLFHETGLLLRRFIAVGKTRNNKARIYLVQFECLPNLWVFCGIIGHVVEQCSLLPEGEILEFQYGPWLKVDFPRPN